MGAVLERRMLAWPRGRTPVRVARWRVPAVVAVVPALRGWVSELVSVFSQADDIVLVTDELVTNAVEHGAQGVLATVRVELMLGPDECVGVTVANRLPEGPGPDRPVNTDDDLPIGGRGLLLAGELASAVGVCEDDLPWLTVWAMFCDHPRCCA